jgi:hypothetical protein
MKIFLNFYAACLYKVVYFALGTYPSLQGEIDTMWNCYLPEAFQPLILVAYMAYNKHIFQSA